MRELIWSKNFIRSVKRAIRKHAVSIEDIEEVLRLLQLDPFTPRLASHKLKGKLSGSWACSLGYDLRIVFDFVPHPDRPEDDIFLLDIGTHAEVY